MYGPRDNFDLETSHVLPALINRFVSARKLGKTQVTLWGTGSPKREFLHSKDLATAVILAADKYDSDLHLNVGVGEDLAIRDLANLVARLSGFEGEILWDRTKPDGTPRKVLDVSRLKSLGWSPSISLENGILETIQWFESNYN
jgi:GDP-L-fucose synthase